MLVFKNKMMLVVFGDSPFKFVVVKFTRKNDFYPIIHSKPFPLYFIQNLKPKSRCEILLSVTNFFVMYVGQDEKKTILVLFGSSQSSRSK